MNLKFDDSRGRLFFPVKHNNYNFTECTVSVSKKNVFRGIHVNNFDKLVTCVNGRILDIIINLNEKENDYLVPQYYELNPETELFEIFIKKNYGHAFLSLEENSVLVYHFNGSYTNDDTKHIHYLDPFINIKIPINNPTLSEKDNLKNFIKPIDYVVFGSTGFLGSNIIRHLEIEKKNFIKCALRLHETEQISNYFDIYKPKYVINCAGITGTPNIFWCDDHRVETIENNITYQLTMAKICKDKNIHLTIFSSGGIFKNDKFYTENDEGNFKNNFYSEARIYLENIVKNYDNVLYLRINYPLSYAKSNKNLLTKILTYENIEDVELTLTYIDNLFPILFKMIENNEKGICNFVNPGVIKLSDILNLYNTFKKHNFKITKLNSGDRSLSLLETDKLNLYNPISIFDAINECVKKYTMND